MTLVKPREVSELLHQIYETGEEKKTGKDFKRYQIQRAVSLGMRLKNEKIPQKIKKGMLSKHQKRLDKALEEVSLN